MRKIKIYPFLFIFTLLLSFFYFPLPSVKSANNWDNFIDFVRTNLGFVSVNNGSLSGMSRDDFYDSLYNTPLVWTDNGQDFSFTPSNEFSRGEWTQVCKVGTSDDTRFNNFNIQDCLIKSDYIKDNGSGYDLSSFPKISAQNTSSPLDGVEVKTNFGNFSYPSSNSFYTSYLDYVKTQCFSNHNNLLMISGIGSDDNSKVNFYSFTDNTDFCYLVTSGNSSIGRRFEFGINYNNSINDYSSQYYTNIVSLQPIGSSNFVYIFYYNSSIPSWLFNGRGYSINDNMVKYQSYSGNNFYKFYSNYNENIKFYCTMPLVIGSNFTAVQNYYYWLKGAPSGGIYTTANAGDTIYNYEYVNNNNWETAYNNYITDVSNYYSTTENITNEQLTQYIDNSTTITNITNNYITNNSGGDGEDDIITNSWLERIYNKILEIIAILKGESVTESGNTYITDNSVKNEIVEYPSSDLFPDVPLDNFIDSSEDFTIDLFSSKLSAVISEAIPFCYIGILGRVSETLSSSPSAPYWEIPFVIDRLNIHESLVLDLTSSDWDNVHNVWIACFLIFFVSFLFYLTYRIVLLVSSLFA